MSQILKHFIPVMACPLNASDTLSGFPSPFCKPEKDDRVINLVDVNPLDV